MCSHSVIEAALLLCERRMAAMVSDNDRGSTRSCRVGPPADLGMRRANGGCPSRQCILGRTPTYRTHLSASAALPRSAAPRPSPSWRPDRRRSSSGEARPLLRMSSLRSSRMASGARTAPRRRWRRGGISPSHDAEPPGECRHTYATTLLRIVNSRLQIVSEREAWPCISRQASLVRGSKLESDEQVDVVPQQGSDLFSTFRQHTQPHCEQLEPCDRIAMVLVDSQSDLADGLDGRQTKPAKFRSEKSR